MTGNRLWQTNKVKVISFKNIVKNLIPAQSTALGSVALVFSSLPSHFTLKIFNMEYSNPSKARRGRGVEFCCLSYPLIKSGAYLIPLEFGFVSGCIIVLTTTTPTIVAAVDTLARLFSLVLLILAIITLAWQVIGLITVCIEMSSIYRLYIRINFLLVLVTTAVAAIGTVVVASKHTQSQEVCTRIYGNPPLNSSNGVPIDAFDTFAPGEQICNYVMWAQTAAMGGLVLILFVTQVCTP